MGRVPLEERRQQFITAARVVIAEHGLEGATTRRIAEAADAPLAALHYCFDSKEDLLLAMWEEHLRSLINDYRLPLPSARVGLARAATDELRLALRRLTENEELAVTPVELLLWARRRDPALGRRAYEMYFEASIAHLRAEVAPGESTEVVAPLARLIATAYDGIMLQWVTFHDRQWLEQAIEMWARAIELYVDQLGGGDRARSAPPPPSGGST